MKTCRIYIQSLLLSGLMAVAAGCSEQTSEMPQQPAGQEWTPGVSRTATGGNDLLVVLDNDDVVTKGRLQPAEAEGGQATWVGSALSWPNTGNVKLTTFCPYPDDGDLPQTVSSLDGKAYRVDYVTTEAANKVTGFTLTHLMAQMRIHIKVEDSDTHPEPTNASIRLLTTATVDYPNECLTGAAEENRVSLDEFSKEEGYEGDADNWVSASQVVIPQTLKAGERYIEFTAGDETFHFTPKQDIELKAGKLTHIYLGVAMNQRDTPVMLQSVTVTEWAQKEIDGGVAEEVDYTYNESTNTYIVRTADALNTAISNAGTSGTTEKPAKIMLMNDIAVEAKEDEYGSIDYAVLIETGNIIIDLNGCQLSATNDPYSTIQIGAEWGELCDAVVTIDDSSIDKSGKIVGLHLGINNNGGTLIINNGTIEVNSTAVASTAIGIEFYKGSVTVNGGTINVTGVAESRVTAGIYEDGDGGTVTINGGSINVNSLFSIALKARSSWSIKGGTITSDGYHIEGPVSLQTNDEGIGATFVGGIKSWNTLNSLLSEGVGYYDADGNLIEVADDVKEITDKGDITVKKKN